LVAQTEADNNPALRLYADSGYTTIEGYRSLMLALGPAPEMVEVIERSGRDEPGSAPM
jgi:hypothetical protein